MKKIVKRMIKRFISERLIDIRKKRHLYKKRNDFYNLGRYSYSLSPELINPSAVIGDFVSIAQNAQIGPGFHPKEYLSLSPFSYFLKAEDSRNREIMFLTNQRANKNNVIIGHDVWIGTNAVVMNGVNIGHGAIVGANAVVTKDVPNFAVVAGVPARIISYRFEENVISKILTSKWWEYPDKMICDLPINDIDRSLSSLERRKIEKCKRIKVCFIIISCIYASDKELDYSSVRSIFSEEDRLRQTKETIKSIRDKCPNADIFFVDIGKKNPKDDISDLVEWYKYVGNNIIGKRLAASKYKGCGELFAMSVMPHKEISKYDLVFKISGRYRLTSDFDISKFDEFAFNFINYSESKVVTSTEAFRSGSHSTRLYAFPGNKANRFKKAIRHTMARCMKGENLETALPKSLKRECFCYHRRIGVEGEVAVDGSRIEE